MLHGLFLSILVAFWWALSASASLESQVNDGSNLLAGEGGRREVSKELYHDLEELSRLVDIAYCVGTTGIYNPFNCAGRCHEFEGFELIETFNTGWFFADSCGYIALSHSPSPKRIIVVFRGTYSVTNAIIDLSVNPQAYVPYLDGSSDDSEKCDNCTVHQGFMSSWETADPLIIPTIKATMAKYPDYQLVVTGHSLGGAIAALAGIEFKLRGWNPHITTFGEPRIGNEAFVNYVDKKFDLLPSPGDINDHPPIGRYPHYYRVTHMNDPVPLLPPSTLDYRSHAGEIFISKADLAPSVSDLRFCFGDADPICSAQAEGQSATIDAIASAMSSFSSSTLRGRESHEYKQQTPISPRGLRLWELFIGHRDYFHRVGICLPNFGDPPLDGDNGKSERRWKWPWDSDE